MTNQTTAVYLTRTLFGKYTWLILVNSLIDEKIGKKNLMRFYKIINNSTKEVFLTAQIDDTTLCGINYQNQPLSNVEELLLLAKNNFTDLDSIAIPLLDSTNLKINLDDLISSSKKNLVYLKYK